MGQVDFGKIISAAAVSTLGVLSLIIVALGVIAFFFFKGSPEKVKLSVWWTMVIAGGLFAAAVVKQSDPKERPDPRSTPTQTVGPIETRDPNGTPDPAETPRQTSPVAPPTATATPATGPKPSRTIPATEPRGTDLSGQWHDSGGNTYLITTSGNGIAIQQWFNGMAAGYGQGTISGRDLRYNFVTVDGNQGGCTGTVATDSRSINGTCMSARGTLPFTVER